MEWMLLPLKRHADFQDRSRRKEYWMFMLYIGGFIMLVFMCLEGTPGPNQYGESLK
ncbi:DUF805 domain-containing protein [Xanthomonas cassavae CFBP 4642]|uniref:DUF805 domain-containing protein n=1 Tax=Xanthomonas cassavae CFBP 4642 TaxID=1219375 RepID=A0ABS8HGC6_9XANT|nr:DUF805 domain-containing protein [Xanthomonas cassavae]MCC4620190.1 DUF805 domain-containing protein [Xanthomonas cassavae CFBP 4642]